MGVLTDLGAPEYDHWVFISDLEGRIWIWEYGNVLPTPLLDISSLTGSGEHGLLAFTFHSEYDTNGLFYVNYVNASSET